MTRHAKSILCVLALVVALFAIGPLSYSAEDAASETAAEAGVEENNDNATDETELQAPADSVGGQMGEVSLEKFIPTEEISADGAVSFPVDI